MMCISKFENKYDLLMLKQHIFFCVNKGKAKNLILFNLYFNFLSESSTLSFRETAYKYTNTLNQQERLENK